VGPSKCQREESVEKGGRRRGGAVRERERKRGRGREREMMRC
jgi:hypothetical protein